MTKMFQFAEYRCMVYFDLLYWLYHDFYKYNSLCNNNNFTIPFYFFLYECKPIKAQF
jgi:hypothetical protein